MSGQNRHLANLADHTSQSNPIEEELNTIIRVRMTGGSDSDGPVVLKLSKAVWLRGKARTSSRRKEEEEADNFNDNKDGNDDGVMVSGSCGGSCGNECDQCVRQSIERLHVSSAGSRRRRPIHKHSASEDVIAYMNSLLDQIPARLASSLVRVDWRESVGFAVGSLSYADMVAGICSMRIEFVHRLMRPLLLRLMTHPRNCDVFNSPVDYVALGLSDYPLMIARPADLGGVKSRLQRGEYQSIAACAADVRLVFTNAMTYNPVGNPIHAAARALLEETETELAAIAEKHDKELERKSSHSCSVCSGEVCQVCGDKCLRCEPPVLVCHGPCAQRIRRNGALFVSADAADLFCQRCYGNLPAVIRPPADDSNSDDAAGTAAGAGLTKKDLLKRRVDEEVWEGWVSCDSCSAWVHKVCALLNERVPDDVRSALSYTCPLCRLEDLRDAAANEGEGTPVSTGGTDNESEGEAAGQRSNEEAAGQRLNMSSVSQWRASSLPRSRLGDFIERMVADRLRGGGFDDVSPTLTVRVTSSVRDSLSLPPPILSSFVSPDGTALPPSLPYTQKSILLFQTIDGVDVCLFSLYVQEFDASCPPPNRSKVYVSYLDSVEYFNPREARTLVYHEVLVAYLKWSQMRGFESAHIWSCPPQRGDSFIFFSHPAHQRTPSRDRLAAWYALMLARCRRLGFVANLGSMWTEHFLPLTKKHRADTQLPSSSCDALPVCPPVFEGDFWVMECLRLHRQATRLGGEEGVERMCGYIRAARDLLRDVMAAPAAHLFAQPVNHILLNIPTYPSIVTRPMDLGTVRQRLRLNEYATFACFVADVRLTFENAMLFNPPGHAVHLAAASLLASFMARVAGFVRDKGPADGLTDDMDFLRMCSLRPSAAAASAASSASSAATGLGDEMEARGCEESHVVGAEESAEWQDELRATSSAAARTDVTGQRGSSSIQLITDLSRSVLRMKDDLFVVSFTKPGSVASLKRGRDCLDADAEDEGAVEPVVVANSGKARKMPQHLHAIRASRKTASFYRVRDMSGSGGSGEEDRLSAAATELLSDLAPDTADPDDLLSCPLVNSRHTLLEMSQFRHMQFDSMRRAKHSSLMLLFQLHRANDPAFAHCIRPQCSSCRASISELRWHCDRCVDMDLCAGCVRSPGFSHEHPLMPFRVTFK